MAIQILILNNLNLHGFVNPYIYPLFLMLLPYEIPTAFLMLIGFASGLLLDSFTNTAGIHASVCTTMCFIRPFLLYIIKPPSGYEQGNTDLTLTARGIEWFVRYSVVFIVIHHLLYFILEIGSFKYIQYTLLKIFFSALLSIVLILLLSVLSKSNKK